MPPRTPKNRFQRWGLDVALPSWFVQLGLVAALLVAGLYAWVRWSDDIFDGDVEMSAAEAAQLEESRRHFFEEPEDEYTFEEGRGIVRHYDSDHCAAILWKLPNGLQEVTFAFHPSRRLELAEISIAEPLKLAGGSGCYGPGPGCCLDPHPPPWQERSEPIEQCVVRVWRYFEVSRDGYGCFHYQDVNTCNGLWGPVQWIRCLH